MSIKNLTMFIVCKSFDNFSNKIALALRSGSVSQPHGSSLGTIKKRKLLDTRCEYFEDNATKESKPTKQTSDVLDPSDLLDLIEDGLPEEVDNEEVNVLIY